MSSRYDDRRRDDRRSDRDSGRPRHDSYRSGPSSRDDKSPPPAPPPRDEKELPEEFGRSALEEDDKLTVVQRMRSSFKNSPLGVLYDVIKTGGMVKVWTRNYKEVRGILTGQIIAFDKHWNIVLKRCHEAYIKRKKNRTPFLEPADPALPDLPDRQPKTKEKKDAVAVVEAPAPVVTAVETSDAEKAGKKKKRKKKKGLTTIQRSVRKIFIRGDNIVMVAIMDEDEDDAYQSPDDESKDGQRSTDDDEEL